jgi:hypothetical protein
VSRARASAYALSADAVPPAKREQDKGEIIEVLGKVKRPAIGADTAVTRPRLLCLVVLE